MTESPSALTMLFSRHTKRREFIAGLGSAAAASLTARAQQRTTPVIGFLCSSSLAANASYVAVFKRALEKAGLHEGRNVAIEYSWANDHYDRLPELADNLVCHQVAVIVAVGSPAAQAAKAATATIPIVFLVASDPITSGLVGSLSRPAGNLTGVTILNNTLAPKQLEILHQVVPGAVPIGVLVNPDNPNAQTDARDVSDAARVLGRPVFILHARNEGDIAAAFATVRQRDASGLVVVADPSLLTYRDQLIDLSARHAIATIYPLPDFPAAGGLMSYSVNMTDGHDLVGGYAGRIVKGEKPADLPVQQLTRTQLAINIKTAKSLGLTIPETLKATADQIIE
jgi:putative tryptophan/tyrosine transport system substrate-binding protein